MKKIVLLFIYILIFALNAILSLTYPLLGSLTALPTQAIAETTVPLSGSYACILSDNTYFYSMPDEKRGVFLLPKTYYVKVLDYQPDYCKIEYLYDNSVLQKITGYARTEQLTFVEYVPKRPYLYYIFDVYYEIGDTQIEDSAFLTQLKVSCVYYGDFYFGGKTYCYVLRGDTFGYIPKPDYVSYEENTEYADYLAQKTPPPSSAPNENTQQSSPAQIGILIALCLLVPIIAALILKQPKRHFYYDPDEQTEQTEQIP